LAPAFEPVYVCVVLKIQIVAYSCVVRGRADFVIPVLGNDCIHPALAWDIRHDS